MSMATALSTQIRLKSLFRWPRTQLCASVGCSRQQTFWDRLFDYTTTIKFRGATFCFPSCFERELQRELERLSVTNSTSRIKTRRIPLGLLMLSRGALTNDQLWRALNEQKQAGSGRIGEWITRLGFAQDADIAATLALQWSCPLLRKLPLVTDRCGIPMELLRAFRMVPIHFSRARSTMHVAFADEIDYAALVSLEQMLNVKTETCLTTQRELNCALEGLIENREPAEKVFGNLCGPGEIVTIVSSYAEKLHASEVRMVVCGSQYWIRIFGYAGAFDLIFTTRETGLDRIPEAVITASRTRSSRLLRPSSRT